MLEQLTLLELFKLTVALLKVYVLFQLTLTQASFSVKTKIVQLWQTPHSLFCFWTDHSIWDIKLMMPLSRIGISKEQPSPIKLWVSNWLVTNPNIQLHLTCLDTTLCYSESQLLPSRSLFLLQVKLVSLNTECWKHKTMEFLKKPWHPMLRLKPEKLLMPMLNQLIKQLKPKILQTMLGLLVLEFAC